MLKKISYCSFVPNTSCLCYSCSFCVVFACDLLPRARDSALRQHVCLRRRRRRDTRRISRVTFVAPSPFAEGLHERSAERLGARLRRRRSVLAFGERNSARENSSLRRRRSLARDSVHRRRRSARLRR